MSKVIVTENDIRKLFKDLLDDLSVKLRSGEATGKDKELVVKLVDQYQIGLDVDTSGALDVVAGLELPFDGLRPQ